MPLGRPGPRRWDRALIAEGQAIVRAVPARATQPGPYQIQAAINAVAQRRAARGDTDWPQIVQLYDQLLELRPEPGRGASTARSRWPRSTGPAAALALVEPLDLGALLICSTRSAPTCCAAWAASPRRQGGLRDGDHA